MVIRTPNSTPGAHDFSAHLVGVDGFVLHLRTPGRADKTAGPTSIRRGLGSFLC